MTIVYWLGSLLKMHPVNNRTVGDYCGFMLHGVAWAASELKSGPWAVPSLRPPTVRQRFPNHGTKTGIAGFWKPVNLVARDYLMYVYFSVPIRCT
jgi:hypothetical protein